MRHRSIGLFLSGLVIVLVGSTLGVAAPATASTGSGLSGHVTAEGSGDALPDISVDIYRRDAVTIDGAEHVSWPWAANAESDPTGNWAASLDPGTYRVSFTDLSGDHRYRTSWYGGQSLESGTDLAVGANSSVRADMALAANTPVTGTVTDANGPVEGITVKAWYQTPAAEDDTGEASWHFDDATRTDAAGEYTLRVAPGSYRVGFSDDKGRWISSFHGDSSGDGEAVPVSVGASPVHDIDGTVAELPSITGTATGDDHPLGGLDVRAYEAVDQNGTTEWVDTRSTRTDDAGHYRLFAPPGTYRLQFSDPKGRWRTEFHSGQPDVDAATDIALTATGVSGLDADLEATPGLSGTVSGADAPIDGATVTAYTESSGAWVEAGSARTDAEGRYFISGIAGKSYRVGAYDRTGLWSESFHGSTDSFDAADTVVLGTSGSPGVDIAMKPSGSGSIDGTARHFGQPAQGVTVTAYRWNPDGTTASWYKVRTTETGPDGRYVLRLGDGIYRISFAEGDATYRAQWNDGADTLAGATDLLVNAPATTGPVDADLAKQVEDTPTVQNLAPPTIQGTPIVGTELTARPGQWEPADVDLQYQWRVGDEDIAQAPDDPHLVLTGAMAGKRVSVMVTATRQGYLPLSASSVATGPVVPATAPPVAPAPTGPGSMACHQATQSLSQATRKAKKLAHKVSVQKRKIRKFKKKHSKRKLRSAQARVRHTKAKLRKARLAQKRAKTQRKRACASASRASVGSLRASTERAAPATTGDTVAVETADTTPVTITDYDMTPCQDIVFVGARGSGEGFDLNDGLGGPVDNALRGFLAGTAGSGLRVGVHAVPYPARAVQTLLISSDLYFSGLDLGVASTQLFLAQRSRMCPSEKYVLSGYSQGAMVMHRVIWASPFQGQEDPLVGVVAVADGDRVMNEGAVRSGTADDDYGITWRRVSGLASRSDDYAQYSRLPQWIRSRFHSVCDRGDIVCDPTYSALGTLPGAAGGVGVHLDDYRTEGDTTWSAGFELGRRAKAAIVPQPAFRLETTALNDAFVGGTYAATLGASGGVPPYRFTSWYGNPDDPHLESIGLHVTTEGRVEGRVDSAAQTRTEIRVVDANGQVAYGTVALDSSYPPGWLQTFPPGTWDSLTPYYQSLPSMSSSGRFVAHTAAYVLGSSLLKTVDVWDRQTGAITTVDMLPADSDENFRTAAISGNGRYVAFTKESGQSAEVFVWDRFSPNTPAVRMPSAELPAASSSGFLSMSSTGRYVAYPSDQGTVRWDRDTGAKTPLAGTPGCPGTGAVTGPQALSGDGRYVVYSVGATACMWDAMTGHATPIAPQAGGLEPDGEIYWPAISRDGQVVTFESSTSNLVPDQSADTFRWLFAWTRADNSLEQIPAPLQCGVQFGTGFPTISDDGRYVACGATTLVWDRQDDAVESIVSRSDGVAPMYVADGQIASLSGDGDELAFASPNPVNGSGYLPMLYVANRTTDQLEQRPDH